MIAIAILIPGLILGAIAWGAVGILRQRGREEFTLATAAAFYAQVALIGGILAFLSGLAVAVKLGFSLVNTRWAYWVPPAPPPEFQQGYVGPPGIAQQQGQDVILVVMLVVIGALVAAGHWLLIRRLRTLAGGNPGWLAGGWLVALTVLTGLAGALSLVVGGYTALTYLLVGAQEGLTFADSLGAAIIFVPAWAVAMGVLMRRLRAPRPRQPAMPPQLA